MNKLFFSIFFLVIIFYDSIGQEISVNSSFDTSRIYLGDQINFTITVEKPEGLPLELPFFKDSLVKNIEILSGPLVDSSSRNGITRIVEKYLITSFDSGFYEVPPVFVELRNEEGMKRFYSDYSMLEVMRINIAPADTTAQIYDIIKPYRAPVTLGEILPWIFLASLLAGLAWIAMVYMRRYKKAETEIVPVIKTDPAHVIAFRELEKLRSEQLWQKGQIKNYYSKLTEILRQYLENRFGVLSLELTTSETLEELVKSGFKKDSSYLQIKSVLAGADLVKFAKYKPESEENESHFINSWDFVESTKVIEVIETTVDKNGKDREVAI